MIHLKLFRIIFFLVSFIFVTSCISQEHLDTLILNNSDTTIIQEYNRKNKLSTEFLYKGNDLILIKSWYYTKKYYGYVIETNDENINSPILLYQYFKNGQLMIIGSYINKKPTGKYKTFYETGQKQCDCNYLDGLLEDQQKKYHFNGQLSEISFYSKGKLEGSSTYYYTNGQLAEELIFHKGKPWTVLSRYDLRGLKLEQGNLKEGNGTYYEYDDKIETNITLKRIKIFHDGKLIKKIKP